MSSKSQLKTAGKYFLYITGAIFLGYFFANFKTFFVPKPMIEITNGKVKKFGILKSGAMASHYFKLKNIGDEDLKVLNVSTRCGCTVPTWNSNPIPPGGVDSIQVVYDTNIIGPFNQSIVIFTNGPNKKAILHVLGIVQE